MKGDTLFLANTLDLGGLEKATVCISNSLSNDLNVTLYSLKGNKFGYKFNDKLNFIESKNLWVEYFMHPFYTFKAIYSKKLYQKKFLNFFKIKKDLDLCSYQNIILSEADILYAKQIKKINPCANIIGWIHSNFESYKNIYMKDSFNEFKDNLSYVDKVIVLSDKDKNDFFKIHNNVFKIANPLTIKHSNQEKKINNDTKVISFVGRLDWNIKGLDYLIEIIKNLPNDWIVSIAGDGKDKEKFLETLDSENIKERVCYRGVLKDEKLEEHYLKSDIFLLTSRFEGFGLVITEAMFFGLPVVAFDSPGPREIIGIDNKFGILIENGDTKKFNIALEKLIRNKNLRNFYSKRSLIRKEDFKIDNIKRKWIDLLC